jgi:two-component system chemotaxis sensor kinase CheA
VDDIVREFLQESVENLDRLDQEFVRLESDPTNTDLLGSIFRTIHTIKGSCGFLGFAKLEKIAHAGENLLSQLRARELTLNEEMADALLKMSDAIRAILKEIHETEGEGSAEYLDLVQRLKELQTPAGAGAPKAAAPAETPVEPPPSPPPASVQPAEPANKADEPATAKPPEAEPSGSKNKKGSGEKSTPVPVMGRIGGALVRRGLVRPEEIVHALRLQDEGDIRKLGEILVQLGLVTERDIVEALADKKQPEAIEPTIRVDVNLLEKQMNLVSELVLLRNRLLQIAADTNERNLNSAIHGLNSVTSELRKMS